MPEGHTIHRLAKDHQKEFGGQKVFVCSPQGRFEDEARKLNGKKFLAAEAFGKHLFYVFGTGNSNRTTRVHIHLGLYGKFRMHKNPPPEPRGAVRLRVIGDAKSFDLNGPNCCEIISKSDFEKLRSRLGQDPLRDDADPEVAWQRIHKSRVAIGSLLLNQSVIAGIGNVYRADILFIAGISPERMGVDISRSEFDELWGLSVKLLTLGAKYNRIVTMDRKRIGKPPSRMKSSERLVCYKKKTCIDCGARIRSWNLASRTMYACMKCQK